MSESRGYGLPGPPSTFGSAHARADAAKLKIVKQFFRLLWILAILAVVVGSVLPSYSGPIRMLDRLPLSDKTEHFLGYAALAFLPALHERTRFIIAAGLGAILLGILLEFVQRYTGWRDYEVADMVADALGVVAGLAIGLAARPLHFVRALFAPARP